MVGIGFMEYCYVHIGWFWHQRHAIFPQMLYCTGGVVVLLQRLLMFFHAVSDDGQIILDVRNRPCASS